MTINSWWRNPSWTTLLDQERLVLSGGADALFLVDEVDARQADIIHRAWHGNSLHLLESDPVLRDVLDRFAQMGAIQRAKPVDGTLRAGLLFAGDEDRPLADLLRRFVETHGLHWAPAAAEADLTLVYRTNSDLLTAGKVAPIDRPHLFIDGAFQHSLSIGPLVWPGETACIGCFAGRISRAWGDAAPPPAPAAGNSRELIAALMLEKVRQFALLGTCPFLVERAVSIDLTTLEAQTNRVHRLPWCPRCFPERAPWGAGSFPLPWTERNGKRS